ncbi:hypothetical protein CEXT_651521 [Caerostris extrusa]|uniref:Uncharacterized protein n=1 Tax=Caerostris extrusa TaxID=172846 RepID=A0AAV4PZM4_CAEEX|nr:hypothetical protein CEXT_651521 [Caerostris extrusa]
MRNIKEAVAVPVVVNVTGQAVCGLEEIHITSIQVILIHKANCHQKAWSNKTGNKRPAHQYVVTCQWAGHVLKLVVTLVTKQGRALWEYTM